MANKSINKSTTTNKKSNNNTAVPYDKSVQTAFFTVWTLIGIIVLLLLAVAIFGKESWTENLHLTAQTETAEQTAPTPQPEQPPQPTQEQLDCVEEEVGEERFAELEQGMPAEEDEAGVIEECLAE